MIVDCHDVMMSSLSLTLRMSDTSSTQSLSLASSAQLMEILEPYSNHMGHNVHALFFRLVFMSTMTVTLWIFSPDLMVN